MRLTPLRLALLFGAALILLGPTTALTQPGGKRSRDGGGFGGPPSGAAPGGFGGPGGAPSGFGGPGGFGNFDPASFATKAFDRYANGKDAMNISDYQSMRDPQGQQKLQDWAKSQGITNGQITRDQFTQFFTAQMAQRGMTTPGSTPPGTSAPAPDLDKEAEDSFKRHDKNQDGFLTKEEASSKLQTDWDTWDKNKDGKIDLAEYKEYYKASRMQATGNRPGSSDPRNPDIAVQGDPAQDDDKRPTVYRAGNLPKEIPPWFAQMDTDRDGQVGLYEWRKGGGDFNLFAEIDRNGDGFLTVEEVLRYQKVQQLAKKGDQEGGTILAFDEFGNPIEGAASPSTPAGPPTGFSPRGFGGPSGAPGGGFGGPGGDRGPGGGMRMRGGPPGGGGNPAWQPAGGANGGPGGDRGPGGFGKDGGDTKSRGKSKGGRTKD